MCTECYNSKGTTFSLLLIIIFVNLWFGRFGFVIVKLLKSHLLTDHIFRRKRTYVNYYFTSCKSSIIYKSDLPFFFRLLFILSRISVLHELNDKKVPRPRTLFIRFGNSFSSLCRPSLRTFPDSQTKDSNFSCLMTFKTRSKRINFPGSPIHVLKIRYG